MPKFPLIQKTALKECGEKYLKKIGFSNIFPGNVTEMLLFESMFKQ